MIEITFSLSGLTSLCELQWSSPRISDSLFWYRRAEPTPKFWELYNGKENSRQYRGMMKKYLQSHRITIKTEFGNPFLFDWNFEHKATAEEYIAQQNREEEELKELLFQALLVQISKESKREYRRIHRAMKLCKTTDELEQLAKDEIFCGTNICQTTRYKYFLK